MSKSSEALSFLKSLWGALAATAVLFPGAAALLQLPITVEHSKIATLYPVIGGVLAAFSLLFATVYRDKFASLESARKWALSAFTIGLLAFFSFVSVRVYFLDVKSETSFLDMQGRQVTTISKNSGVIMETTKDREGELTEVPDLIVERGDPWDLLALVFFSTTFASLTFAFSALGLHAYINEKSID